MISYDIFLLALYCGTFIFACTTLGSAIVFVLMRNQKRLYTQLALGFSAGIMMAASIFSLILPAIEISPYQGSFKLVPVIGGFIIGIMFLISIDKSMPHLHVFSKNPEGPKTSLSKHTLMFLAITIHNIPEGMAVGVSAAAANNLVNTGIFSATAVLALGIGIQNIPEGAAISMPYFAEGMSRIKAFILGSLSGIVEPIAAITVVLLAETLAPLLPWFLSFAAGAMMYVVIEELIPQAHDMENSDKGTISVLLGFILMMFLDVTLG